MQLLQIRLTVVVVEQLPKKLYHQVKKYEQGSNTMVHRPDFVGDSKDTRSWLHWCNLWISECHRVLKMEVIF